MSETVEYFEDIDIGDEIAELDICPTTADVVRFVGVARMQSGRFTDDAYARQEGLPGAIVPGNMSLGFLSRMLTEFFPAGCEKLNANPVLQYPQYAADLQRCRDEKQTRDSEHVLCDVVPAMKRANQGQGTAHCSADACCLSARPGAAPGCYARSAAPAGLPRQFGGWVATVSTCAGRFLQGADGPIQTTPQIPCSNGAIRHPLARMAVHGDRRRQPRSRRRVAWPYGCPGRRQGRRRAG